MTPNEFKASRLTLGLTQKRIGERLSLSVRQIIRYEDGTTPVPEALALLIDILITRKIPRP
jgi:transcriptional regulator with XRE-family HTH domain